jgi:hypothetical protein
LVKIECKAKNESTLALIKEIKGVLFELKHNKGTGPDHLPVEFYQVFWDAIKVYLKENF